MLIPAAVKEEVEEEEEEELKENRTPISSVSQLKTKIKRRRRRN